MNLVCLIISGERIHDDINAGAIGQFTLARTAGNDGEKVFIVAVSGPGGGIIVGADNNGGDTIIVERCICIFLTGNTDGV